MKYNKKVTGNNNVETSNTKVGAEAPISNLWVEQMFNPKLTNHPQFKELSAAAKTLASLILKSTPPGEGQKRAIESLGEAFLQAGSSFVRSTTVGGTI